MRGGQRRIIGPNANATFRDLATSAKEIGLCRLSALLELTFRDDIRNGIAHADYVIWNDGLRIRNRNGGNAVKVAYEEVSDAINRAIGFFHFLSEFGTTSMQCYNPPKTIVGRFSANPPMPWTVSFDPKNGAFGISGSSAGSVVTPEYQRQIEINGRLGGKVLATYSKGDTVFQAKVDEHIIESGFEPHNVKMNAGQLGRLVLDTRR